MNTNKTPTDSTSNNDETIINVLILGEGGREHALARACALSPQVGQVHVVPGRAGMQDVAVVHNNTPFDQEHVIELAKQLKIDLIVVGPEAPLAEGWADHLRSEGFLVFGPSKAGAQLEASKIAAKRFMQEAGIPTAKSFEVRSRTETLAAAKHFSAPFVLKADGLAAGKGVVICQDIEELDKAAQSFFEDRLFGAASDTALLEEYQDGWEISSLVITNGKTFEPLLMAADHKRLRDHDEGPNTGGMGAVAPFTISTELQNRIQEEIFYPTFKHMQNLGLDYRGVLYAGLMITKDGPKVIEFNVRFGDPEAQVLLPLLDGKDWVKVFYEVAKGQTPPSMKWRTNQAAACLVLAAAGYPDKPRKGDKIKLPKMNLDKTKLSDQSSYFIHAGTTWSNDAACFKTAGGRVLNVVGLGSNLQTALELAYSLADQVQGEGLQIRRDIGRRVLNQ